MNDYADAAERHYASANVVLVAHPATASHCYGISAECVLKALMSNLIPQPTPISTKHLGPGLWAAFVSHPSLASYPARVTAAQAHQMGVNGWDVNQRYLNHADSIFEVPTVVQQQASAQGLVGLLQQVKLGLI